jgi:hypothetical protein
VVTGVSPSLVRRIRALAVLRGKTVPEMVDEVLQHYLDTQGEEAISREFEPQTQSPWPHNPSQG